MAGIERPCRKPMDPLKRERPARDASGIVQAAAVPAISTDASNRILAWNRAASELLEDADGEVLIAGRNLHLALQARDVFGNRLCPNNCALDTMIHNGEAVQQFQMDLSKASGGSVRVGVSVVVVVGGGEEGYELVYLMGPRRRRRRADEAIERILAGSYDRPPDALGKAGPPGSSPAPELTQRELEVLRLLAEGQSTADIAGALRISANTVRRHCQNLMHKLGVHSKVEAVSLALRQRWI